MLKILKQMLYKCCVWGKFRRFRLLHEGRGCIYRELSSNFSYPEKISFGKNVHVGPGAMFDGAGEISIDDGTIFAPNVKVFSRSHNFDQDLQALPFDNVVLISPVIIGRYVWIGANAIILPGVHIGDGAVIGAGAVVARDVPSCGIAVGNPAKVVRFRDSGRFDELAREEGAFVYEKFGHGKVLRNKARVVDAEKLKN